MLERRAEALGQDVVGELGLGPTAARLTEAAAALGVIEQSGQGGGRSRHVTGIVHDETRFAMLDRFARAAAAARYLGHTAGSGFEKDDPESLLFQAGPSIAAQHGEHVGTAEERW
jgi:hypothetical protein